MLPGIIAVHEFTIGDVTFDLYPPFRIGDVDKVDKAGPHLRNRTGIARPDQTAGAQLEVDNGVGQLAIPGRDENLAIFDAGIQLLNAERGDPGATFQETLIYIVIGHRRSRRKHPYQIDTELIGEALAHIDVARQGGSQITALTVSYQTMLVSRQKIGSKGATTGITDHRHRVVHRILSKSVKRTSHHPHKRSEQYAPKTTIHHE